MPYTPPPDLADLSLAEIASLAAAQKLPPVREWMPAKSGDSEMRITADGRWFHQGGLISRPAMVRAFSHLLRKDADGSHWLVTPYEKLSITVEDAPFVAVEMQHEGEGKDSSIAFRLNNDDLVILGRENPLILRDGPEGRLPYLHVRDGLDARLARPVYYELAEQALAASEDSPMVWSGGLPFLLGEAA